MSWLWKIAKQHWENRRMWEWYESNGNKFVCEKNLRLRMPHAREKAFIRFNSDVRMRRLSNGSKNVIICKNSSVGNCTWVRQNRMCVRMIEQWCVWMLRKRENAKTCDNSGMWEHCMGQRVVVYEKRAACECWEGDEVEIIQSDMWTVASVNTEKAKSEKIRPYARRAARLNTNGLKRRTCDRIREHWQLPVGSLQ